MTIPEHAQASIKRAAQYIKDKPNFQAFIAAFTEQFLNLEDTFTALKVAFLIDTAEGTQLDVVGKIVQQPREGRTDALYRPALRARILVNNSSGTIEELYAIANLMAPGGTYTLTEYTNTAFVLQVFDYAFNETEFSQLVGFLRDARAAGVNGFFQGMFASRANSFILDGTSSQALDNGLLSGIEF